MEKENMCCSCTCCIITENFTRETSKLNETVEITAIVGFCTIKQTISYSHIENKEQLITDVTTNCSHYNKFNNN